MKSIRLGIAIAITIVVVGGYAASQIAYLLGPDASAEYELKLNDPRVHGLMLVLLIATVALAFASDRKDPAP